MKVLASLVVIAGVAYVTFFGLHMSTGYGLQVGYVSAIERTGLIFKTNRVYIKPTLESTQEDSYCVVDGATYAGFEIASREKIRVEVRHDSWLIAGISNCSGEDAVAHQVNFLD